MIELASELRAEVDKAGARLRGLGESEVARDRGPGKWVKKEILGHLIDSAANNHQRFVLAQFSDPFVGPAYDQQRWVATHGYRDRAWGELVEIWIAMNRLVAQVIELVPAGRLATRCRVGDGEPVTVEWLMRDYVRHLRHHIAQLLAP